MAVRGPGLVWGAVVAAILGWGCADDKDVSADATEPFDLDGDGYAAPADCDDDDDAISPGVRERCDGVDDDCDGEVDELGAEDGAVWYADLDGDGVGADDASVSACAAPEGFLSTSGDCDDNDAEVGPDMSERCNGIDDDCDGDVDENGAVDGLPGYWDADGDGAGDPDIALPVCTFSSDWVANRLDCDDDDPTVWGGAPELCDDIDNDCDGEVDVDPVDGNTYYLDSDGDGQGTADSTVEACERSTGYSSSSADCDDSDEDVHTRARELCDGRDNDCDGVIDTDATDMATWYEDQDEDGFGSTTSAVTACEDPWGDGCTESGDCDDADPAVNSGADELWYDGIDQDCAGDSDFDADADGYVSAELADPDAPTVDPGTGEIVDDGSETEADDCDDADDAIHPDADEVCDGVDSDCDGELDAGAADAVAWYPDGDDDGYGRTAEKVESCDAPGEGWVRRGRDCDDSSGDVSPAADEVFYDGLDQDCRGDSDWDADADGYVDAALDDEDAVTLDPGTGDVVDDGSSTLGGDCDDAVSSINPGVDEVCDGIDNDCDGAEDLGASDALSWYQDGDADGAGSSATAVESCERPSPAYTTVDGDCDDDDPAVYPGATERWYDGLDGDCAGDSDWDADGDGYVTDALTDADEPTYDPGTGEVVDSGASTGAGDCDDESSAVSPGAAERCDGVDNDCDGEVDLDAPGADTYYVDSDDDGYGLAGTEVVRCRSGTGYAYRDGDCDDTDDAVSPAADEMCDDTDGVDNDCDGHVDMACGAGWISWAYGESTDPSERDCELYWSTTWSTSAEVCDDCDWTFDVALTYEPELSDNSGGCVDESAADLSWTLGVDRAVRMADKVYRLEGGDWTKWDSATLDETTYRLTFHDGDLEELESELYWTDYWQGSAELYELTR